MRILKLLLFSPVAFISVLLFARGNPDAFYMGLYLGLLDIAIFLVFLVSPLVFWWFPHLIRLFIFAPETVIPDNIDLQHPENIGFVGARNVYCSSTKDALLGLWHTLPSNLKDEVKKLNLTKMEKMRASQIYSSWMADATVFLYLHGSAGMRTTPHRLRMYHLLNQLNYHVVTVDYRGYGDSTSFPMGESDLIMDVLTAYNWIQNQVITGNIFLWGHSLGTGIAAHVADILGSHGERITGIVLEAPYTNMADALRAVLRNEPVTLLPWFEYCLIKTLADNDLSFETDMHLKRISTPALILHAKDDQVLPYQVAVKLYKTVAGSRKDPATVQMVGFDSRLGYGHDNISMDPNLSTTVQQFVDKCKNFQ